MIDESVDRAPLFERASLDGALEASPEVHNLQILEENCIIRLMIDYIDGNAILKIGVNVELQCRHES